MTEAAVGQVTGSPQIRSPNLEDSMGRTGYFDRLWRMALIQLP